MKKKEILICIFITACMLLCTLGQGGGRFTDLVKDGAQRYHPNGSEPVYVGIFGE